MFQLRSKLQHNTYEKGEYSDEQHRSLDETIQLIKAFPWDAERALTDIQLTGPSVTIQDNDLNYLKLGLYFNGKFCVYYLDSGNHLYEYHAETINEACELVKDFFEQTLNLKPFDKHLFNIGNKPHFVSSDFIYRVNPLRVIASVAMLSIYALFIIYNIIAGNFNPTNKAIPVVALLFIVLIGLFIGYLVFIAMGGRNQYLQISRGNNHFSYGIDSQHIVTYNKADIEEIVYTQGRNMSDIKIRFKNGEVIKPTMLIKDYDLIQKFPEKSGVKITYIRKTRFGESKTDFNQI